MIEQKALYNVLLPDWIWEKAQNMEDVKRNVLAYMKRYPHYKVVKVSNQCAVCVRIEER